MPNYFIIFLLFVLTSMQGGCAFSRSSAYVMVDRVIVKNATVDRITDVRIKHRPTNKIGGVSVILPDTSLDIGFSSQPLIALQAVIHWTDAAGQANTVQVDLPYNRVLGGTYDTMTLEYQIHSYGNVSVRLRENNKTIPTY